MLEVNERLAKGDKGMKQQRKFLEWKIHWNGILRTKRLSRSVMLSIYLSAFQVLGASVHQQAILAAIDPCMW